MRDGVVAARREAPTGGWETYEIPLPAVVSVKEGLNLPRYPSIPGRLRARRKEVERVEPDLVVERTGQGRPAGAGGAGRAGRDPRSRPGDRIRRSRPAGQDRGPRLVSGVLVVVEHTNGEPDRLSREALALGTSLATTTDGDLEAVLVGPGSDGVAAMLGGLGVRTAHVVSDERLAAYAPAAWAAAIAELMATRSPSRRPRRRQRPRQRGARAPRGANGPSDGRQRRERHRR